MGADDEVGGLGRDGPAFAAGECPGGGVHAIPIDTLDDDRFAALLVRPDGVIAWAAAPGAGLPLDDLRRAMVTWFPGRAGVPGRR